MLVGQPQLRTLLLDPELAQLNQRITLRWHIGPLSFEETAALRPAPARGRERRPGDAPLHAAPRSALVHRFAERRAAARQHDRAPRAAGGVRRPPAPRGDARGRAARLPRDRAVPLRRHASARGGSAGPPRRCSSASGSPLGVPRFGSAAATAGRARAGDAASRPGSAGGVDPRRPRRVPPGPRRASLARAGRAASRATAAVRGAGTSSAGSPPSTPLRERARGGRGACSAPGGGPLVGDETRDPGRSRRRSAWRRGLETLPLTGNLSMLRLLDLPAVLELRIPGATARATSRSSASTTAARPHAGRQPRRRRTPSRSIASGSARPACCGATSRPSAHVRPAGRGRATVARLKQLLARSGVYAGARQRRLRRRDRAGGAGVPALAAARARRPRRPPDAHRPVRAPPAAMPAPPSPTRPAVRRELDPRGAARARGRSGPDDRRGRRVHRGDARPSPARPGAAGVVLVVTAGMVGWMCSRQHDARDADAGGPRGGGGHRPAACRAHGPAPSPALLRPNHRARASPPSLPWRRPPRRSCVPW